MYVSSLEGNPSLVVIVDDQEVPRTVLVRMIRDIGPDFEVVSFGDASHALAYIRSHTPDLIITDYRMPVMDGVCFTRKVREISACIDVPLVMVTIVEDKRLRYKALDAGATDFLTRPIDVHECRTRCRNLLTLRHQQKIIRDRASWLESEVALKTREILERERETLFRLAKAGEYRDTGTGNHVLRISHYSRLIAEALGLAAAVCSDIELAAPTHDIGKVGIPDDILLKPGMLDEAERAVMRRHSMIGYEILKDSPSRYLQMGAAIARHHHEKFDGSGYPDGLRGTEIPLQARIVSVADVFDALTSTRPYKSAWSLEEALTYIRNGAESSFDPLCVQAFLTRANDIRTIKEQLHDEMRIELTAREGQIAAGTTAEDAEPS